MAATFNMVTGKQTEPQRKTFRAYTFNKISYAAVCAIVAVVGGVAYFGGVFPQSSPPPTPPVFPQQTKVNLPVAPILITDANGICHMRALDNSTGAIMDYGVVDCSNAANKNSAAWNRAMSADVGTEVSKSFRHE
jgi:hypothetical protein